MTTLAVAKYFPSGLKATEIDLYEAWNKPAKAGRWRAKLAKRDDAKEQD